MERGLGNHNKIKVLFFLGNLCVGGAERIASNLMQYLDRDRFNITLVLCEDEVIYFVPNDVKKYVLLNKKKKWIFNHLTKLLNFYKILIKEKPKVILSFMEYPNIVNVLFKYIFPFQNIKHIISIHIIESLYYPKRYWCFLKFFYSKADVIICTAKTLAKDLIENFSVPKNKCIVIYNPINLEEIDKLKNEEVHEDWFKNDNPKIIAAGRLSEQKGYEYLLKAFKIVSEQINASLIILGEGEERKKLEKLANDLKITEKVYMPGFKKNPHKYVSRSDVFVLSSLHEAVSNVLFEAMVCGVPTVVTRCPSGYEEILTHGVNSLFVPVKDEKALAEAIIDLLRDKNKSEKLAKEGRKIVDAFDIENIIKEYEKVFLKS